MTIENDAIVTDADNNDYSNMRLESEDEIAKAFLGFAKDADKPSENTESEKTDDDENHASDGNDTDGHEDHDEGESEADDEDNRTVRVKVNGEDKTFTVKDLKRLAGRESALTTKETEIATRRKAVEADREKYAFATSKLLERAAERYKPYEKIDWLVAAQDWDAPTLKAVREEALKAYQDVEFHKTELTKLQSEANQEREKYIRETALKTKEELERDIPDLKTVFPKMRDYALEQGVSLDVFNQIIDAQSLKILHKAMLYDRGQKAKTTPVAKTPTRIIKTTRNVETSRKAAAPKAKPLGPLNTQDEIANAFLSLSRKK